MNEKIKFIDTHCHFDFYPFSSSELESLKQAMNAGIEKIIVPAVEKDNFFKVLNLSLRHESVYASVGLHPIFIQRHNEDDLDLLEQILKKRPKKLVAIGEIGLDASIEVPQRRQQYFLDQQLRLACDYELPVILHSRHTHDILIKQLKLFNLPRCGVVHGFSGSFQQAKNFISAGYSIGVGGAITYPRAKKTRSAIAQLPLDVLVLETDAPDMPLYGYQGRPNRPEQIFLIWKMLCELRNEKPEVIACALMRNTERVFRI